MKQFCVWGRSKQINSAFKHFMGESPFKSHTQITGHLTRGRQTEKVGQPQPDSMQSNVSHLPAQQEQSWVRPRGCLHIVLCSVLHAHRHHAEIQTAYIRKKSDACLYPIALDYSLWNNCSHAPVIGMNRREHSFEEDNVLAWEKGPGMGKADYFKDWMWASGSKHAECTWREISSRISAARLSRWDEIFITEGYIR